MATRADIRSSVTTLLGTDPHLSSTEINAIIELRYAHLHDTFPWASRRREFVIRTVAQVDSTSSDGVTVTNGSTAVTSAGTPFTSAMTGRQMVISGEDQTFYITFTSTSEIALADGNGNSTTWPGATAIGSSWRIFQTVYSLPSDAEAVESVASEGSLMEIDGGRPALDEMDPTRDATGDPVTHWCYAGAPDTGVRRIEVWPVPTAARLLRGQYIRALPTLDDTTVIAFNRALLVWSVAADCYGVLHAKTGDVSYKDLGLFYERKAAEVAREVRGVEMERMSLPASFARGRGGRLGADFWVSHQDVAREG